MLRLINSLLVIICAGLAILTMFLIGHGLAQHQAVFDVMAERWYLLAAFIAVVVFAIMTRGRRRSRYRDE